MAQLYEQLQQGDRVAITAIQGMGGIGKTELALRYADHHRQQGTYPGGVGWFRVRGVEVGTQIVNFARTKLGLALPDGLPDLKNQVDFCWGQWRSGKMLAVFDDVNDYQEIAPYLPPADARFSVLLTTRVQLGSSVRQLSLDVLSEAAALELLRSLIGSERVDRQLPEAKHLCQWLGYLPLGLELVGRYLARKPDLSIAEMQQRLEAQRLDARALQKVEAGMTATLGVAKAFELSWQELDEEAQQLCGLLSLFAPAPIDWRLVEACLGDRDSEALEEVRDESLLGLHLLQQVGEGTYQLHPLLRQFFQAKLESSEWADELKRRVCRVMVGIAQQIPDTPTREQILAVTPFISHLAEVATTLKNWVEDEDLAWPYVGLGRFYGGQGVYAQALPWFEQCLSVSCDRLGTEHPNVATSLNNLAGLYYSQGRYGEAEPLYRRALELRERILGAEHPAVATSLNNLALLYQSQGRYGEVEPLFRRALELRERLLGAEHPAVATSLNNLAGLYYSQGRYGEAEPLFRRSLKLREHLLGAEHPDVASSLNSLAWLYYSQGRYGEAEPLYRQALELRERILGAEHPDVASSLNNLAVLYHSQGRYGEAEPLYRQALELSQRILGAEHPDVAQSLNNLAELYRAQGRYEEAEPLYLQALGILFARLGDNHPNTIAAWRIFVSFLETVLQNSQTAVLSDNPLTQNLLRQLQASQHQNEE